MKRLQHITWTTTAILSLVFSVAIAGLWVRSYSVEDIASLPYEPVTQAHRDLRLTSINGRLMLSTVPRAPQDWPEGFSWASLRGHMRAAEDMDEPGRYDAVFDHGLFWRGFIWGAGNLYVSSPHWGILLLTASPVLIFAARRKLKKRPKGICAKCGYDLRATPQRCPECGTVPSGHSKGAS